MIRDLIAESNHWGGLSASLHAIIYLERMKEGLPTEQHELEALIWCANALELIGETLAKPITEQGLVGSDLRILGHCLLMRYYQQPKTGEEIRGWFQNRAALLYASQHELARFDEARDLLIKFTKQHREFRVRRLQRRQAA